MFTLLTPENREELRAHFYYLLSKISSVLLTKQKSLRNKGVQGTSELMNTHIYWVAINPGDLPETGTKRLGQDEGWTEA